MTVMIENYGWADIVMLIDWFTKKVVAHEAGMQSQSCHWLMALDTAAKLPMEKGQVSLLKMGITQAFRSYNNPKRDADTERFMRTLKEE